MSAPTLARTLKYVTDGGMETDLIFHHGLDLPHFAAFPLVREPWGRRLLREYYDGYAAAAATAGARLLLESPTWRANPDWGSRLGYDAPALAEVNTSAIDFLHELAQRYREVVTGTRISGMVGPRSDGYRAGAAVDADDAATYHRPQIEAFTTAGADIVTAYTLTDPGEAIGIVRAARQTGVAVAVSFTVDVDGRLPNGASVGDAIGIVDAAAPPDHYLLNCAHPDHMAAGLDQEAPQHSVIQQRVRGVRYNASTRSHAELDEAADLDAGNLTELVRAHTRLAALLPNLDIVGGCCGTDSRHVAALWGVQPASSA